MLSVCVTVEIHLCNSLLCVCFPVCVYALQSSQQSNPQTVWVVPALRQLHEITRSFIKQTYQKQDKVKTYSVHKNLPISHLMNQGFKNFSNALFHIIYQSIIQDLKKNFEIVKLITGSLVSCHRLAVSVAGSNGLSGSTLVDGRYTYQEVGCHTSIFPS